ncbi:MAG: hypothetical protein R3B41_01645 [Candidatus Doudnabacteria bacterium]
MWSNNSVWFAILLMTGLSFGLTIYSLSQPRGVLLEHQEPQAEKPINRLEAMRQARDAPMSYRWSKAKERLGLLT